MRPRARASILPLLLSAACAPAPVAHVAAPRPPGLPSDVSCAVWERENGFAASVAAHDARAFAEHVHPGAVFVQGDGSTLRGRDAIVAGWSPIIRGDGLRLEWHPTSVVPTGDPGRSTIPASCTPAAGIGPSAG